MGIDILTKNSFKIRHVPCDGCGEMNHVVYYADSVRCTACARRFDPTWYEHMEEKILIDNAERRNEGLRGSPARS